MNLSSFKGSYKKVKKHSFKNLVTLPYSMGEFKKIDVENLAFEENKECEKGFSEHYSKYIKRFVGSFEEMRIKALATMQFRLRLFFIFLAPFIYTSYYLFVNFVKESPSEDAFEIYLFINVAYFGFWAFFINKPASDFSSDVKEDVFRNVFSFFKDFSFSINAEGSSLEHQASEILPNYDKKEKEDRLLGKIEDVDFEFIEITLKKKRRSKNRTYYAEVFDGVVLEFSMNKDFSGKTMVLKDSGFLNKLTGAFTSGEKVALEDPEFEKKFEVYSSDQIEARYLLTTSFMQRLLDLRDLFEGSSMQCLFDQDKFYITIETSYNFFEPGSIFDQVTFIPECKKILEEIDLIGEIVRTLKLNQDIYKQKQVT